MPTSNGFAQSLCRAAKTFRSTHHTASHETWANRSTPIRQCSATISCNNHSSQCLAHPLARRLITSRIFLHLPPIRLETHWLTRASSQVLTMSFYLAKTSVTVWYRAVLLPWDSIVRCPAEGLRRDTVRERRRACHAAIWAHTTMRMQAAGLQQARICAGSCLLLCCILYEDMI